MKTPKIIPILAACLLPLSALAANPIDGTWKGDFKSPDGNAMTLTFTLKADGDKLTGSVDGGMGTTPFSSGSITGDAFDFKVPMNDTTIDHKGTVSGDTITMMVAFGDQAPSPMTLTRVPAGATAAAPAPAATPAQPAAPAAADPTGAWKWSITRPGSDQPMHASADLAYSAGTLTGSYHGRAGDTPISDASFKDGAIAFSVVRERDGNQFVIKYKGTLSGDSITGTVTLPGFDGGESSTVAWAATRSK